MYHVALAFQCILGPSDEGGEDVDGKKGLRFLEEGRVEITCPLVCI